MIIQSVSRPYRPSMIEVLRRLNLTSGLQACLDAGNAASYDPAVQTDKWLDQSGNGQDFYRGSGTGSDAADPTFNGTAGRLSNSEYFSFDGADRLTYDSANETWMESMHKAGAIWSVVAWVNLADFGGAQGILGTRGAATGNTGVALFMNTSAQLQLHVYNAGAAALSLNTSLTIPATTWAMVGLAINEASGASGLRFAVNGSSSTATSTYSSPAAGAASFAMQLGTTGNAANAFRNGSRLAQLAVWSGVVVTAAQFAALFNATRGRYGV